MNTQEKIARIQKKIVKANQSYAEGLDIDHVGNKEVYIVSKESFQAAKWIEAWRNFLFLLQDEV